MAVLKPVHYQLIEGFPEATVLTAVASLNESLFGLQESTAGLESFFRHQTDLLLCLAWHNHDLIGYKIGFQQIHGVFESWRGGVSLSAQRQGIGRHLLAQQHQWCAARGYRVIVTTITNTNTPMLQLNVQHGFRIVGLHINQRYLLKINLKKQL